VKPSFYCDWQIIQSSSFCVAAAWANEPPHKMSQYLMSLHSHFADKKALDFSTDVEYTSF
jgi:hypothetical protein